MNADIVEIPLQSKMGTKALGWFLALTFALTWGLAALFILFTDQIAAIFGEIGLSNPLVILAVYSPGIAGVFLVWRYFRFKGLFSFFRRLTLWRAPGIWWLFLVLGIPAVVYTGAIIKGSINDPFPFSAWYEVLPALALALFLGPIEEFGWRGLALPLLQRRFAPFWAGLILGGIWALWHVPAFLISGMPQTSWSAGPYFLGIIAISVILTPLFNASSGSLLIAVLYHFQMMNPIWPDAQPWDNFLFVALAIIIVWLNRRTIFQRGSGVTAILMAGDTSSPVDRDSSK
jgi:membrane protease YdiL (CAAX protease family)